MTKETVLRELEKAHAADDERLIKKLIDSYKNTYKEDVKWQRPTTKPKSKPTGQTLKER